MTTSPPASATRLAQASNGRGYSALVAAPVAALWPARWRDSAIDNALASLKVIEEFGSLDAYLWSFVGGKPVLNGWSDRGQVPASTPLSDRMSKDLKKRGFRFVGTTICYAFMQATGMVNDHIATCFRHKAGAGK
ncbi:DNA-3-methyladenine glycosylase I [Dyella subtropica]|uniref:DNA-3-methyladenine glycosylase I n=1 Tax=Dyella subtropica TaxID=2992127 RepID=UPI003CE458F6